MREIKQVNIFRKVKINSHQIKKKKNHSVGPKFDNKVDILNFPRASL